jgi:hypothetical protein
MIQLTFQLSNTRQLTNINPRSKHQISGNFQSDRSTKAIMDGT